MAEGVPEIQVGPPFPEGEEANTHTYDLDQLNLEEARDAEELHAVYRDLEFVIQVGDYLVRGMEQRERQRQTTMIGTAGYLEKAFYMAALVAYARCFGTGKRKHRLDDTIFTGDAEHLLERHKYYKDTRDKHLAHSVNAFEITKAAARIEALDTDNPRVETVGVVHVSRTTEDIDDVRWLVKLATYVQTIVYGRLNRANVRLDKRVRSLPTEQLKKLKELSIYPPMGPEAAASPRP